MNLVSMDTTFYIFVSSTMQLSMKNTYVQTIDAYAARLESMAR